MGSLPVLDSQGFTRWRGLSRRGAYWLWNLGHPLVSSNISAQVVSVTPRLLRATWIQRFRDPTQLPTNSPGPWLQAGLTPRQWTTLQHNKECFFPPTTQIPKCFTNSGFPVLFYLGERISLFPLKFPSVPCRQQQSRCCLHGCCPTEPCPPMPYRQRCSARKEPVKCFTQPAALPPAGKQIKPAPTTARQKLWLDPCTWPHQRYALLHPQPCQHPIFLIRLGFWRWFSHFCNVN